MDCTCKQCREVKLNPEPSVSAFAQLERARRTGKTTNPKWYHNPAITRRAEFVPGLPAYVPAWTRSKAMFAQVLKIPMSDNTQQYVKEFDQMNRLKPCPIVWVSCVSYG